MKAKKSSTAKSKTKDKKAAEKAEDVPDNDDFNKIKADLDESAESLPKLELSPKAKIDFLNELENKRNEIIYDTIQRFNEIKSDDNFQNKSNVIFHEQHAEFNNFIINNEQIYNSLNNADAKKVNDIRKNFFNEMNEQKAYTIGLLEKPKAVDMEEIDREIANAKIMNVQHDLEKPEATAQKEVKPSKKLIKITRPSIKKDKEEEWKVIEDEEITDEPDRFYSAVEEQVEDLINKTKKRIHQVPISKRGNKRGNVDTFLNETNEILNASAKKLQKIYKENSENFKLTPADLNQFGEQYTQKINELNKLRRKINTKWLPKPKVIADLFGYDDQKIEGLKAEEIREPLVESYDNVINGLKKDINGLSVHHFGKATFFNKVNNLLQSGLNDLKDLLNNSLKDSNLYTKKIDYEELKKHNEVYKQKINELKEAEQKIVDEKLAEFKSRYEEKTAKEAVTDDFGELKEPEKLGAVIREKLTRADLGDKKDPKILYENIEKNSNELIDKTLGAVSALDGDSLEIVKDTLKEKLGKLHSTYNPKIEQYMIAGGKMKAVRDLEDNQIKQIDAFKGKEPAKLEEKVESKIEEEPMEAIALGDDAEIDWKAYGVDTIKKGKKKRHILGREIDWDDPIKQYIEENKAEKQSAEKLKVDWDTQVAQFVYEGVDEIIEWESDSVDISKKPVKEEKKSFKDKVKGIFKKKPKAEKTYDQICEEQGLKVDWDKRIAKYVIEGREHPVISKDLYVALEDKCNACENLYKTQKKSLITRKNQIKELGAEVTSLINKAELLEGKLSGTPSVSSKTLEKYGVKDYDILVPKKVETLEKNYKIVKKKLGKKVKELNKLTENYSLWEKESESLGTELEELKRDLKQYEVEDAVEFTPIDKDAPAESIEDTTPEITYKKSTKKKLMKKPKKPTKWIRSKRVAEILLDGGKIMPTNDYVYQNQDDDELYAKARVEDKKGKKYSFFYKVSFWDGLEDVTNNGFDYSAAKKHIPNWSNKYKQLKAAYKISKNSPIKYFNRIAEDKIKVL